MRRWTDGWIEKWSLYCYECYYIDLVMQKSRNQSKLYHDNDTHMHTLTIKAMIMNAV